MSNLTYNNKVGGNSMAKPMIQLALDSLDFDQTLSLAEQTAPYIDIF